MYANVLASQFAARGVDLVVITRRMDPESPAFEMVGAVPVRRISPQGILKGKGWRAVIPLSYLMVKVAYLLVRNSDQYDILLVSGVRILSVPSVVVGKFLKKKTILRVESPVELKGAISTESLTRTKLSHFPVVQKFLWSSSKAIIRRADGIIAPSPEIQERLLEIGVDAKKIRSIPNGVDMNKYHAVSEQEKRALRSAFHIPCEKTVFIYTGRLAVSKGLLVFIGVWNELVRAHEDIHLILVGSGKRAVDSCEDQLRAYIRENHLEQSVTLVGEVEDVSRYLQASDLFVFPSFYEGFGLSLLEAMACCLPAVSTRVGVAGQVIQDRESGILADPEDAGQLREGISWLLEHRQDWPTIAFKGRSRVMERYSLDAVIDRFLETLVDLYSR